MNKKNLNPILIILLIVFIGATIYFANKPKKNTPVNQNILETPTIIANQTLNWKTYTNNKYNFSFKFPSEQEINITEPSKKTMNQEIIDEVPGHTYLDLIITQNAKAENIESGIFLTVQKRGNSIPAFNEKTITDLVSKQENTINGIKAIRYTRQKLSNIAHDPITYIIEKNGYIYTIGTIANPNSDPYYFNIIDKLVTTLQFK